LDPCSNIIFSGLPLIYCLIPNILAIKVVCFSRALVRDVYLFGWYFSPSLVYKLMAPCLFCSLVGAISFQIITSLHSSKTR
jgi:hypothetical protein